MLFTVVILFLMSLVLGDVKWGSLVELMDPEYIDVVMEYRFPRVLVGLCAAINFTLSGLLLQVVTKNNLTTPNIVGINTGASFFAVVSLLLFSDNVMGVSGVFSTNMFSFMGSLFACLLFILFARKDFTNHLNILNGIALDSIFIALTAILLLMFPNETGSIALWLTGSLWGKNLQDLTFLLPSCLVGVLFCLFFGQRMNILSLSNETSISLGIHVRRNHFLLLLMSCFLAGTAVASTGPIGFISLFVPNVTRLIVGENIKKIVPFSILLAGIIIIASDILSRVLIPPEEIPIGVIVAIICSPYLIFLVKQR